MYFNYKYFDKNKNINIKSVIYMHYAKHVFFLNIIKILL